ncbi:hypothetical protein RJ639_021807 [Escallonia herrerae]|uniref:Bet v I/Major latex protein domain-containing protein n=1 Tax=Escallonia herrerae TaxID=1293975 RepID=A0AA88V3E4_9ASTE|nr:hypothetical protein RJ639_021807 [Escallonia herrerae]
MEIGMTCFARGPFLSSVPFQNPTAVASSRPNISPVSFSSRLTSSSSIIGGGVMPKSSSLKVLKTRQYSQLTKRKIGDKLQFQAPPLTSAFSPVAAIRTWGSVSTEMEVDVPATEAWKLYGTVDLKRVTVPQYLAKVEIVQGDGGEGSICKNTSSDGSYFKERFTKVDNTKLVKETEETERGHLDYGFTLFRIRFECIPKTKDSCITRTTIEYTIKEEALDNIGKATISGSINIMKDVADYLIKQKSTV